MRARGHLHIHLALAASLTLLPPTVPSAELKEAFGFAKRKRKLDKRFAQLRQREGLVRPAPSPRCKPIPLDPPG